MKPLFGSSVKNNGIISPNTYIHKFLVCTGSQDNILADWLILILTLPNPEGHLQVLPAPAAHLLVIRAQLPEIRAADGEQTTRHCW